MNFFALRVGDIHTEDILRILQHESHLDRAIAKLGGVPNSYRMIGSDVHRDVHGPVLEVHLLITACAGLAVRGPAIANFLRGFLRFVAVELVFKDELAAILCVAKRQETGNGGKKSECGD